MLNAADMWTRETSRRRMVKRLASLRTDFLKWRGGLEDLFVHLGPNLVRWNTREFNQGRVHASPINNTGVLASRTLASGLMATVTSPLREWFRETVADPELADFSPVKRYLHVVEERLRWALARGSYYQGLADTIYPCLGVAGFGAGLLEEDPRRIVTLTGWPIGEFYLAAGAGGTIDTSYRETPMTVRQIVKEFCVVRDSNEIDLSNVSSTIKNLWNNGGYDEVVEMGHVIQPNGELEPGRLGWKGKGWASYWFELKGDEEKFVHQGGYEDFPVICPRWGVLEGETYGRGPGYTVLGDTKQLQHHERALARLIDLSSKPTMVADESMRGNRLSVVPGDVVYAPRGQVESYRPAVQVNPAAIVSLLQHIERVERRIDRGMYADLLARVLRDERNQRATATEIEEMSREVAALLGPAIERLNSELYIPSLDRTYGILERRGFLPVPPPELQGQDMRPEFISVLHQAQKGVQLQPLRVFVGELANVAALRPDSLDKLNADELVDEIARSTGVKPSLVLDDEEVAKIRSVRAKREQAMQQGQAMLAAAKGIKDLGTAPAPAPTNALGALPALIAGTTGNLSPPDASRAANAPLGPVATGGFPTPGARA